MQTARGRATTVFAIKLAVQNVAGKLKSGMPTDVFLGKAMRNFIERFGVTIDWGTTQINAAAYSN